MSDFVDISGNQGISLWKKRDKNIEWGKVRENPVILYVSPLSVHWKSLEAVLHSSNEHMSCSCFHL